MNPVDEPVNGLSAPESRKSPLTWAAAAALLCGLVWLGYGLVYAQFQSYDDEGYLLITVQQFLQGIPLYDEVYTQYGPAYYLWQQILHGILGIPLTHNATRLVTLAMWLACSSLVALVVWLLTRRIVLTGVAAISAFLHLTPLTFEPGHPQELCLLSSMLVVVIALWRVLNHGTLGSTAAASIGVLVAITAFTKVNVGALLICALTLAVATSVPALAVRRSIVRITALAVMIATLVLLRNHLFRSDVTAFIVIIWSGLLATLFLTDGDSHPDDGIVTIREVIACAAGMSIASIVIVSAIVQQGTSMRALYSGLFVLPLRFPTDLFWTRVPVPPAAGWISLFWLVAAVCLWSNRGGVRRWLPYVNLTMSRLVCLLSVTNWFNPLLAIGPPLASALLADSSLEPRRRTARRIVAFAAVLMALQAYPMPGTQVALGTLLLLPIALVLMPEAEHELNGSRRPSRLSLFGVAAPVLVLVTALGIMTIARTQQSLTSGIALRMPGAEKVRASESDVAAYGWLVANLRAHCDRFITAPGFNSLHFWTGIPPVSSLNTTVWPVLLDDARQQQILDAAAPVGRLCVVSSAPQMAHLLAGQGTASRPLAGFIAREFESVASFGEWEFRVRRGRQPALVQQARRVEQDSLVLDLPPLAGQRIRRVQVVDLDAATSLADSADTSDLAIFDEQKGRLDIQTGIDLSSRRRLVLRVALPSSGAQHAVVVRLWADGDRLVETVPVVTAPTRQISSSSLPGSPPV